MPHIELLAINKYCKDVTIFDITKTYSTCFLCIVFAPLQAQLISQKPISQPQFYHIKNYLDFLGEGAIVKSGL